MNISGVMARAVVVLALLAASTVGAQGVDGPAIEKYVRASMEVKRIPGLAVAVVKDAAPVYVRGFGVADLRGRPVAPSTPFLIGSITKTFTATAVMQLVETGTADLDGPVVRYLPWFRLQDRERSDRITIRQLITMTSGIPQWPTSVTWFWPDYPDGIERHARYLARIHSFAEPGTRTLYANSNYIVLAALVERVSGLTFSEYVARNIFNPLSMRHSHTIRAEAEKDGLAHGHRWWLGIPLPSSAYVSENILPAGLMSASADDMAHYLVAWINGGTRAGASVLSPRSVRAMLDRTDPHRFGLGWEFSDLNGRSIVNFDGGNPDSQASVFFDPDRKIGVFVAANVMSGLDAFSSHAGAAAIDGPTTREMAETIFAMASGEPLPDRGIGITRLTIIEGAILLALTALLAWSFARPRRRLARISAAPPAAGRFLAVGVLRIALPVAYAVVIAVYPPGRMVLLYQPDAGWWIAAAGAASVVIGVLELSALRGRRT